MKLSCLFTLLFLSIVQASANYQLEIGTGRGEVKGDDITANYLQLSYTPAPIFKALNGDIGYAFGLRSSFYSASLFQARKDESEKLEDVNIASYNAFAQVHYLIDRYQVGFNLDIIGVSAASSSTIEDTNSDIDNVTTNIFLFSKNDRGSLNSHLFLAAHFDSIVVKLIASHSVIEFEDTGLSGDDKRQMFFDTLGLGVGYKF